MSNTRFYSVWSSIYERCNLEKNKSYPNYGGRGIKLCKKWYKFSNFKEDMHETYLNHVKEYGEKQTTIDRIDVNGNYCKENCRWATKIEQANNRRSNVNITLNGVTKNLTQWCDEFDINMKVVWARIKRNNWPIEKALTLKSVIGRNQYSRLNVS